MPSPSSRLARRLAAVFVAVSALAVAGIETGAEASGSDVGQYLGRWNYDQPDTDGTRNMAVLRCPEDAADCAPPSPAGDLAVPQVGDVEYMEEPGGVVARTDMGCVWHFVERNGALQLAPTDQYCFNPVYGVGYTIADWTISVRGDHQREVIHAISHRPSGDYEFVGALTAQGIRVLAV